MRTSTQLVRIAKSFLFVDKVFESLACLKCRNLSCSNLHLSTGLRISANSCSSFSYFKAAKGEISEPLYNQFCEKLKSLLNKEIKKGIFGADMKVSLINDGPVTIWIDSKNKE